jgi:hypothetical protein
MQRLSSLRSRSPVGVAQLWIVRQHREHIMPAFTFIADYDGGTYISQCAGTTPRTALLAWLQSYDFSVIPKFSRQAVLKLRRDLAADNPVPVESAQSVWCVSGRGLLIHIVKTSVR